MLGENPVAGDAGWATGGATPLQQLRHATAELAAAVDLDAVVAIVVAHAKEAVSATIATLALLSSEDTLEVVGSRGGHPDVEQRWRRYSVDTNFPDCEAFRTSRIVVAAGGEQFRARYPSLPDYWPSERSVVGVPLSAGSQKIGVIGLVFDRIVNFDEWELQLLGLFAETCAQVIIRIRAVTASAEHTGRLALLSNAAAELASSLDYTSTLANVAQLVVATLADWCTVDILNDGLLSTVAVSHVDPAKTPIARRFRELYRQNLDEIVGVPTVLSTGRSMLQPTIANQMLAEFASDETWSDFIWQLEIRSAMSVPLIARGRTLGVLTLISSSSHREYTHNELLLAEDLADRAALAIDNAQLYSQTRDVATALQRAVLPEELPEIEGWEVAAQYRPSGRTDIGGDFYDLVRLPEGGVVAVLGDVMGRGVTAAADMAQIRAAIRAYIITNPDPAAVLAELDRMFARYRILKIVTLVYAILDPATGVLSGVNAGHPPPMIVDAKGLVDRLPTAGGPPLGALARDAVPRSGFTRTIEVGSTFLLYTDGLIERRGEDIDAGLNRLSCQASLLAEAPLASGLEDVIRLVQDETRDDDIAALALRREPLPGVAPG